VKLLGRGYDAGISKRGFTTRCGSYGSGFAILIVRGPIREVSEGRLEGGIVESSILLG
jgi:hypothetical protein